MTPAQLNLLKFIIAFQRENSGMSPSLSEMVKGLGKKSKGGLCHVLGKLEGGGHIKRKHYAARAIEVCRDV